MRQAHLARGLGLALGLAFAFAPTLVVRAQDGDPVEQDASNPSDANPSDALMTQPDQNAALADAGAAPVDDAAAPASSVAGSTQLAANDPVICWPDVDENGFPTEQCSDGQGPLPPPEDPQQQPQQQTPQPSWWERFRTLIG